MQCARWEVGFSRGKELVSNTIAYLDRVRWEDEHGKEWYLPSEFNHVFFTYQYPNTPKFIYESHINHGVQINPFRCLEESKKVKYYYLHPLNLSKKQSLALMDSCVDRHDSKYDSRHIIGLLLWIKMYGHKQTKRPRFLEWSLNDKYICSELTETAGSEAKIDLCGDICTPVTATPEAEFTAVVGAPSGIIKPEVIYVG